MRRQLLSVTALTLMTIGNITTASLEQGGQGVMKSVDQRVSQDQFKTKSKFRSSFKEQTNFGDSFLLREQSESSADSKRRLAAPVYSGALSLGTFKQNLQVYLQIFYSDFGDDNRDFTYTVDINGIEGLAVTPDDTSPYTGLQVAFNTGSTDSSYDFFISVDNGVDPAEQFTFTLTVNDAVQGTEYFSSAFYDVLEVEASRLLAIPESKLCMQGGAPDTTITYLVDGVEITSTTDTELYYLTTSGDTSQPLLNINHKSSDEVGSHLVEINCGTGVSTKFPLELQDNAAPVWTAPATAVAASLDFSGASFTLDLSGAYTDTDSTYQTNAMFKAYISTSNSDKSLIPTYLSVSSNNLNADGEITITYTHANGGSAGVKSLYIFLVDPFDAQISKAFTLTIVGCDAACAVDQCTATEDNTACTSCNSGYTEYFEQDGVSSYCATTCPTAGQYRDTGDTCQDCDSSCETCVGPLTTITNGCLTCNDGFSFQTDGDDTLCIETQELSGFMTLRASQTGVIKLYYDTVFNDADKDLTYHFDDSRNPSWISIVEDPVSSILGVFLTFTVPSDLADGSYFFYVHTEDGGPILKFFKFEFVISASASSSPYFNTQIASLTFEDRTEQVTTDYLCSSSAGPVTSIQYKIDSSVVSSTTTTDPFYLTTVNGQPLLNINNPGDGTTASLEIICTLGAETTQLDIDLTLTGNTAPDWINGNPIEVDTDIFQDQSELVIDLTGLFTDSNIGDTQVLTDMVARISTSSSDATLLPAYLYEFESNGFKLDASYQAHFLFSYDDGATVGLTTLYLHLIDDWGASDVKTVLFTVQGCDSACNSDTDCTTLDSRGCSACETGHSLFYDADGAYCGTDCTPGQYRTFAGSCESCSSNCGSCTGPGATIEQGKCVSCSVGAFRMPPTPYTCQASCSNGYTYANGQNLCFETSAPSLVPGFTASYSVVMSGTYNGAYSLGPQQNGQTYTITHAVYAGATSQNNLNTGSDIKASKPWIAFTCSLPSCSLALGSVQNPIPDVDVAGVFQYYTLRITVSQTDEKSTNYDVVITHQTNLAPAPTSEAVLTLASQTVYQSFNFYIRKSAFTDPNTDQFEMTCTNSLSWISMTKYGDDYYFQGITPAQNSFGGRSYQIPCTVTDTFGTSATYQFTFYMNLNGAPTWTKAFAATTVFRNQTYTQSFAGACSDPNGNAVTITVFVNGFQVTKTSGSGFSYQTSRQQLVFAYDQDSYTGTHTIQARCTDGINTFVPVSNTLTAQLYRPPNVLGSISDIYVDIFTTYTTIPIGSIFSDPQQLQLTFTLSLQSSNTLPETITSFQQGQINFAFTQSSAGTIPLKVTATNSQGISSFINFRVIVRGCYNGCSSCTSTSQNACTACSVGFNLHNSQCIAVCPVGTWTDSVNRVCNSCPSQCSSCSGSSATTQCSSCSLGYYLLNSGCHERCPTTYWEQDSTRSCQLIDADTTINYNNCLALLSTLNTFESSTGQSVLTDNQVKLFTSMSSSQVTCSSGSFCSDADNSASCSWRRKFALQCSRNADGVATIRVATNSMPDHCIYSQNGLPREGLIDFKVIYDKQTNFGYSSIKGQLSANNYRCSSTWLLDDFMMSNVGYRSYQWDGFDDVESIVGVAFNGVPIHQSVSEYGFDPLYPQLFEGVDEVTNVTLDRCLGSFEGGNFYHYYSLTQCIISKTYKSSQANVGLCSGSDNCYNSPLAYTTTSYPATTTLRYKGLDVVGIARDGHLILGPYKNARELWQPCDVDFCNGVTKDGNYYYASTMFHPYTVGCWGPGSSNMFSGHCSSKTQVCQDFINTNESSSGITLQSVNAILSLVSIMIMLVFY